VLSVPNPAGAEGDVTLKGVSCATTSYCTAVGKYTPGKEVNSEFKTLSEYWDGEMDRPGLTELEPERKRPHGRLLLLDDRLHGGGQRPDNPG
jgi:hypothetical protein